MAKLLRITTVAESLRTLLPGQLAFMREQGFTVWSACAPEPDGNGSLNRIPIEIEEGTHFSLPLTRQITPFRDAWSLLKTCWLMLRLRPDIVHTHTPKAGLIGMLAAWLVRVPVRLHTVAGLPLMERRRIKRLLLIVTEKLTYACATGVWPNSFGLENYIQQHLYKGPKLRVIGNGSSNGINSSYFQQTPELIEQARTLRHKLQLPSDAFVWVFVGRLVRDKGIEELIIAFRAVLEKQSNARLILVGDEEELDPIGEDTKASIANNDHILTVGYQSDVRPYMLLADTILLPSYREGLPNVLLQAACLERPVIASDIVGCRELVLDGKTGILVPPKNPAALCQAMLQLMGDVTLRRQMGQAARAPIVTRYDQQQLWQAVLLAYKQALAAADR